jgi:hypothetical protein
MTTRPRSRSRALAVADVELGGMTIKAGDPVLPLITSANRDEQRFAAPYDSTELARRCSSEEAHGEGLVDRAAVAHVPVACSCPP